MIKNKNKGLLFLSVWSMYLYNIHAAAWKTTQGLIHLGVSHRTRKLTTGLLPLTHIHLPIRTTHGVHLNMLVKTK
jgi:hypothetical protein